MIDKFSINKVNDRILEVISDLSWLREKVADLSRDPNDDTASEVDSVFAKFVHSGEALRNAIVTLSRDAAGVSEDENGESEVDVIPEPNGFRLN
jgi:hypothetical protein